MSKRRRILPMLGVAAGGFAAAAVLPMALAHADDCTKGLCDLVSGGKPDDVVYTGFRPLFEDWQDTQPTNVEVPGSSFVGDIAGSYQVTEEDYSTALMDNAIYHFSDFTPAASNTGDVDGDLAGASVYDFTIGPGGKEVDGTTLYDLNNLSVTLGDGDHVDITTVPGEFTNFLETTPTGSGDWVEAWGSTTPTLLFDGLTTAQFPAEVFNPADYLPPDDWFPVITEMFPAGLT